VQNNEEVTELCRIFEEVQVIYVVLEEVAVVCRMVEEVTRVSRILEEVRVVCIILEKIKGICKKFYDEKVKNSKSSRGKIYIQYLYTNYLNTRLSI
jgi:hypothetical protein